MNINQAILEQHGVLDYGNNPELIILHHVDMNGSVQDVNRVHLNNGWCMIGYNYYVRKDGSVWKGRDEKAIGANCYGYNGKSISICAEGNFMTDTMGEAQKQGIIAIGQDIESRYGNKLKVVGHKELLNTDCPGTNYPLADIKNQIVQIAIPHSPVPTALVVAQNNKVLLFQRAANAMGHTDNDGHKLVEDGVLGTHTLQVVAKALVLRGTNNALVGVIQTIFNISVDNIYGNAPYHQTYDAITGFQRSKNLVIDGKVGFNTWVALLE